MAEEQVFSLLEEYKKNVLRFRKTQRSLFKKFATSGFQEILDDFCVLAIKFSNCDMHEYSALCWQAAAKCEKDTKNKAMEIEFLIRAGKAFVAADQKMEALFPSSNHNEFKDGALKCYNDALEVAETDSMKASIIRLIKKIQQNAECTSNLNSPSHRIFDLEVSANGNIMKEQFTTALEKFTEICDNITERKVELFYKYLLERIEISVLLLLLLLKLPPARLSPIHIRILEKYSKRDEIMGNSEPGSLTANTFLHLQSLVTAKSLSEEIEEIRNHFLTKLPHISAEQEFLLQKLLGEKFK